jgi:hypothetical protein
VTGLLFPDPYYEVRGFVGVVAPPGAAVPPISGG